MNKKKLVFLVVTVIVIIVSAIAMIMLYVGKKAEKVSGIVYYLNKEETELIPESEEFIFTNAQDIPVAVINKLKAKKVGAVNPVPDNCAVNTIVFADDGKLEIDFSEEFLSESPYKNVLRVYAVVKSLCASAAFCGVNEVKVLVENEPVTGPDGYWIDFLSGNEIVLSGKGSSRIINDCMLYYKDKTTGTLRAEKRVIEAGAGNLEKTVVNELIKGPVSKELTRIFSYDTVLVSAQTVEGICFVNLKNIPDNVNGNTAVMSIVKSLTALPDIDRVQILIDGKTVDEIGGIDVSAPIKKD